MQTGRTLDKGEVQVTGGFTNISSNRDVFDTETGSTAADVLLPTIVEAQGRAKFGLGKKTDLGISISASPYYTVNFEGEIKHQIIGDNNSLFALSAGLKAGFGGFFGIGASNITVPLYASIHPNDFISFYSSPRFKHVKHMDIVDDRVKFFGLVNGLNISIDKVDLFLEHGALFSKETNKPFGQLNAGVAYTF